MNLLQRLPNAIEINSRSIPIKTDFRVWLKLQGDIQKVSTEKELIQAIKSVFLDEVYGHEFQKALNAISNFFSGAKGYINHIVENSKTINTSIPYDFEKDSNYIYSAFMEQYNIDLFESELHYYKFIALFECLHDETTFKKIVGYRMTDTRKIKDKNMRVNAEKMKSLYEIKDEQAQIDFESEKQQILSDWG